jgi:hypothetical protein
MWYIKHSRKEADYRKGSGGFQILSILPCAFPLNVVAHGLSGPPVFICIKQIHKKAQGGRTCQNSNVHLLKDVLVKTGVGFLAFSVSFTVAQKEGFCKIEGRLKKGVMVGLESASGQV